jgi:hypothetical protein
MYSSTLSGGDLAVDELVLADIEDESLIFLLFLRVCFLLKE